MGIFKLCVMKKERKKQYLASSKTDEEE